MAASNLRDQTELTLVNKNGQTWAQLSEMLLSPASTAAALSAGSKTVTIGADGYSQWLRAATGLIVSFNRPDKGRAIVFGAAGPLWDSATSSGEVYAPKGSFIELLGNAGATFTVTTR